VASVLCDSRFEFVLRTPLIENYDVEMLKRSYGGNPCANKRQPLAHTQRRDSRACVRRRGVPSDGPKGLRTCNGAVVWRA
jgi:hypothetical protein